VLNGSGCCFTSSHHGQRRARRSRDWRSRQMRCLGPCTMANRPRRLSRGTDTASTRRDPLGASRGRAVWHPANVEDRWRGRSGRGPELRGDCFATIAITRSPSIRSPLAVQRGREPRVTAIGVTQPGDPRLRRRCPWCNAATRSPRDQTACSVRSRLEARRQQTPDCRSPHDRRRRACLWPGCRVWGSSSRASALLVDHCDSVLSEEPRR
jgi:hypothetical protein